MACDSSKSVGVETTKDDSHQFAKKEKKERQERENEGEKDHVNENKGYKKGKNLVASTYPYGTSLHAINTEDDSANSSLLGF